MQQLMADLNRLHVQEPALHELDFEWAGFDWIEANDAANSVIAFQRRARNPDRCHRRGMQLHARSSRRLSQSAFPAPATTAKF